MKRRPSLPLLFSLLLVAALVVVFWSRRVGPAAPSDTPRAGAAAQTPAPSSVASSAPIGTPVPDETSRAVIPKPLADELARLLAIADPETRYRELDLFWRRWFARDREGAIAALAGLPTGDERAQALHYVLLELASADPDRALDLAIDLVADQQDAHLFSSLFDTFAKTDLAAARERLARVPPGLGFAPAWRAFTDAYASRDLAAALDWARGLETGPARTLAIETALYTYAEKDAYAAFETALQTLDGEALDRSLYQALRQVIPHDPAAASALITGMPASPQRELATAEAARAWADDAPEKALAWAASLPEDAASSYALAAANILEIWAQSDAAAATAAVATLPEGEVRSSAAERVAGILAGDSVEKALVWSASLPDETARARALASSLSTWARTDAPAAAAWAVASSEGSVRESWLADIVSHWALQDRAAAARYVNSLGDPALKKVAADSLAISGSAGL